MRYLVLCVGTNSMFPAPSFMYIRTPSVSSLEVFSGLLCKKLLHDSATVSFGICREHAATSSLFHGHHVGGSGPVCCYWIRRTC